MADPTYTTVWSLNHPEGPLEYNTNNPDQGLVTCVHYKVVCTSSEGHQSVRTNTHGFDKGSTVTPFESLTESQVIGWVKTALGDSIVAELETKMKNEIIESQTPKISLGKPSSWSS
tara:strand:- start:118 stop:465 length:348 start_codon:yes stop_codon:yes gene_type:complete